MPESEAAWATGDSQVMVWSLAAWGGGYSLYIGGHLPRFCVNTDSKDLKVACFDTLLQVFILKVFRTQMVLQNGAFLVNAHSKGFAAPGS
jgi:hypothetical protein